MEHILFTIASCKPCIALKKNIKALETQAKLDTSRLRYVDVQASDAENAEGQKYNIRGVPTLLFINDEGVVTDTYVGYRTEEQLLQLFAPKI